MRPTDNSTIEVHVPNRLSGAKLRAALATCAIEGNQFAIDALETIRRAEAGEPVGAVYAERLNDWMREQEREQLWR